MKYENSCFWTQFITARNSSCGKVMFSQVCVIPSVHGGWGVCLGGILPRRSGVCIRGIGQTPQI